MRHETFSGGAEYHNVCGNITLTKYSKRVQIFKPSDNGFAVTLPENTAEGEGLFSFINDSDTFTYFIKDSGGISLFSLLPLYGAILSRRLNAWFWRLKALKVL